MPSGLFPIPVPGNGTGDPLVLFLTPEFEIRYTEHYIKSIGGRPFLEGLAEVILQSADARYYDSLRNRFVAVKRVEILGSERDVALAYEVANNFTWLITMLPLKEGQQRNRLRLGRWVRYEP